MKLSFKHSATKKPSKPRFNPHTYWIVLLCSFILILSAELVGFSWYFLITTKKLDAPAVGTFESNGVKINSIKKKLDIVETAVKERVDDTEITAQ